jgi:hypothetical protein
LEERNLPGSVIESQGSNGNVITCFNNQGKCRDDRKHIILCSGHNFLIQVPMAIAAARKSEAPIMARSFSFFFITVGLGYDDSCLIIRYMQREGRFLCFMRFTYAIFLL